LQIKLKDLGHYSGAVDGVLGNKSLDAIAKLLPSGESPSFISTDPLVWGSRVSEAFRMRVRLMARLNHWDANDLMTVMAFESGGTFSASVKNAAGSGAVGLIQFMPATARAMGTTTEALAALSPVSQLDYVERYLAPFKTRLKTLSDLYMAILWPAAVGQPEDYVLFRADKGMTKAYFQNRGLDVNKDLKITKGEAAALVLARKKQGEAFKA